MKRNITLCLLFCLLALLMTGCKSSDYKQAQSLFYDGQYDQAKAMFLELEDYKESRTMVSKCTYKQAQSLFNDGQFEQAKTMYEEVADYEDSREMITMCIYSQGKEWLEEGNFDQAEAYLQEVSDYEDAKSILKELPNTRLMYYLENAGELVTKIDVSKDSSYTVTLKKLTDEAIEIIYEFAGRNSTVTSDTVATMVLELGQSKMQVQGTYHNKLVFFGKTSTAEEAVEGELDIRTYKYGDEMLWDKTYFKGSNVNGEPLDPNVSGFFQVSSNAPLERAFKAVETMLADNNVGVTLKQIGFASLG